MKAIVITRDRVSYARRCVSDLHRAGLDVHIVDHGSTYEPAVEWLRECGLPVVCRGDQHPRSLWEWEGLREIVGEDEPYIVTDPDVVVDAGCPRNWPEILREVLESHAVVKVGLGLRIDDLPAWNPDADRVRTWEAQYWKHPVGKHFDAWIDTTLALYRPLSEVKRFDLGPAIRTGFPYVAHHLPWYEDPENLPTDVRYYREHALKGVSHWLDPENYGKATS